MKTRDWEDGDVVLAVAPGLGPVLYRRLHRKWWGEGPREGVEREDFAVDNWIRSGKVLAVHQEEIKRRPMPVVSSAILATFRNGDVVRLIGPDDDGDWLDVDGGFYTPKDIKSWEPLLSKVEWDEQRS